MEDKRVGKSNRSKAICITVIVLLCIGLTSLFLMEYRSRQYEPATKRLEEPHSRANGAAN